MIPEFGDLLLPRNFSFFKHYVRVGKPSIFGKVSNYYATVETNDRGALHLHGLLWLENSLFLPNLISDLAKPEEEEYRLKVKNLRRRCLYRNPRRATGGRGCTVWEKDNRSRARGNA